MDVNRTLRANLGWSLPVLILWAVLAALWNFGGVWQLAQGLRAPGPTATVVGGLVLLAIAVALGATVGRWDKVFVLVAIVAGLAALVGVVGAFTQDPALWPSEAWRWAGIVLNGMGFAAAVAASAAFFRRKPITNRGAGQVTTREG